MRRGELYTARLGPVEGSEEARRPVVVVSNDLFNEAMPVVTILPVTTYRKGSRIYPSEVLVGKEESGLRASSLVLSHQVRTIAKSRLGRRIGSLRPATLSSVDGALRLHLGL